MGRDVIDILAQVTCPVCQLVMETEPRRSQRTLGRPRPSLGIGMVEALITEAENLVQAHMKREHKARDAAA